MKLKRPAVLITAGAQRLGLALVKEALCQDLDVVLHYRSDKSHAERWLRRNREYIPRVSMLQKDLAPECAEEFVDTARKRCVRLVGLVNNASTFTPGDLADLSHLQHTLDTNALVPAALASAFAASVRTGWIVNITDAHVAGRNRTYQNYRISKRLLDELTQQQAFLFAPRIRVNAIAPGAMLPAPGATRAEFRKLARTVPLGRTGRLQELRSAFAYLVSNTYVTGQVLYVDGGWHLVG